MPSASALVRSHSRRVFVPERRDFAERLARFSTCRPWPAAKSVQRCADSGMCMGMRRGGEDAGMQEAGKTVNAAAVFSGGTACRAPTAEKANARRKEKQL